MEKETKIIGLEVKDFSASTGEVTFKFADPSKDQVGDIILTDMAYKKSITENKNIYHNRDHKEAIGKPSKVWADGSGAYCTSQLAMKTVSGSDAFEQYKAGLVTGHSQEYVTVKSDYSVEQKARIIKEARLFGVTTVTNIPANLNTPTISLKSFEDVADHMQKINNLLHEGNISDKCGEKFLTEYKRLEGFVKKNQLLKDNGIVHCEKCQTVHADAPHEEKGFGKCPDCGQFMNKPIKKSFFIGMPVENFSLKRNIS